MCITEEDGLEEETMKSVEGAMMMSKMVLLILITRMITVQLLQRLLGVNCNLHKPYTCTLLCKTISYILLHIHCIYIYSGVYICIYVYIYI